MTEQSQFETLIKDSDDSVFPFPFPPHRRRHLKSETFCTLVRILSHCSSYEDGNNSSNHSHSNQLVSHGPKQGSGENNLGQASEPEVHGELVGPTGVESETLLIEGDSQSLEVVGSDECLDEDRMQIDEPDRIKGINKEHFQENGTKCGTSLEDRNPIGDFVSLIGDQEGQCNLLEFCLEESANERQIVVEDKEHPNLESLDLCLDIDILDEFRKLDKNNAEGNSFLESHELEEVGHEMQIMELEKSVSNSGAMNPPLSITVDKEIEEGEVSGNFGLYDKSTDLLPEDAAALEKKVDEEQIPEAIYNEEQVKAQKAANQEDPKFIKNFVERIVNGHNAADLNLRESNLSEMDCKSEMVVCVKSGDAVMAQGYDSELETRRKKKQDAKANEKFNHPAVPGKGLLSYDDVYPAVSGEIPGGNATENHGTLSTNKDAGVHRKGKRGPLTEERKGKKKKKRRIKRAEKNKLLGVKRLKIQPVLKPKTVSYCRHYLQGRCQEGEKCKFSHDAVPLTKSKPCGYFARHSCMKGDDCPYDHELSKYPCNNLLSKGYCSRRSDCMFSHEVQPKEGSSSTITLPRSTNSGKQSNLHTSSPQKGDSKSGSTVTLPFKNNEQNIAETMPKGISKLMFGKSSLGNANKLNQAVSSPKADLGAKFGLPPLHNTLDIAQNRRVTVAPESKGLNFLSFGKAPLHDSTSIKRPSSLSLSKDFGIQKPSLGDSSKDKQTALSSQKDDNSCEMPKRTPAAAPRGINFLSFGKAPFDDSSNTKPASSVQERESASKLQIPGSRERMLSSSLHSDQSRDLLADEHSKDTPSSALKALFSNTPNTAQKGNVSNMTTNSAQKSLQSMLAFAAKYESRIKMDLPTVNPDSNKASSSSQISSKGSTILDFLYSGSSKIKQ